MSSLRDKTLGLLILVLVLSVFGITAQGQTRPRQIHSGSKKEPQPGFTETRPRRATIRARTKTPSLTPPEALKQTEQFLNQLYQLRDRYTNSHSLKP